ncbi:MAG TPA: hypothetical protein VFC36_08920, partial [Paludibacter sp.]|nr:hypothetical protein [Paludibacter sp.]
IGTTNPGAKLDVNVADGLAGFKVTGATGKLRVYPYFDATYGTTIEAMNVAENGYVPMTLSGSKFIFNAGNVGIGTTTPEAKLTVKGKIVASEIQVKDVGAIPDYVFKPDYELMSLSHVEEFVKQNQHLPEVPSEKEFQRDGMNMAEMNALLLKKIEELTLYAIEQNKKIETLEKTVNNLIAK